MDSDLQHLIETSAPPLQLSNLSTFRSLLFKYKRKAWLSCACWATVIFPISYFPSVDIDCNFLVQVQEKSEKEAEQFLVNIPPS